MSDNDLAVEGFSDDSVEPGVWRYAQVRRAHVIVDAEEYFELMQQAMVSANRRIFLIGWDFDTRIHLSHGRRWWQKISRRHDYPARLGGFIVWLSRQKPALEIRILKWGVGIGRLLTRGTMVFDLIRWFPHKRIDFKFDNAHPIGCSHHQKVAVLDHQLAVCGGIDMTDRRWDTRDHIDDDPRRVSPRGVAYGPWHDITLMMEGPVAQCLEAMGRHRWVKAGGRPLDVLPDDLPSPWPKGLAAEFENVEVGIARTRAEYKKYPAINEIEELYKIHIARAKRFIYAENQYFASRVIAEAIAKRLIEPDPPEIILVGPAAAHGVVESAAMDPARNRLAGALAQLDHAKRFHMFTPHTAETPIYVHAKLLIIDDEVLRVGSSNHNNRSLGLDSECDVFIDCARPGNAHAGDAIRNLRHSLLAEHCGVEESQIAGLLDNAGSMAAMIIQQAATGKKRSLRALKVEPVSDTEAAMADLEVLDPEEPAEMFQFGRRRRSLFRKGSLLARAVKKLDRKQQRR